MSRFREVDPGVYQWTSTCQSYVLKHGDKGLLIDPGDGSVLDHLDQIGVRQIEWVLFTHHHREQCQCGNRMAGLKAKTACATNEKQFFENPASFRRMTPKLQDPFTVHGTS